MMLIRCGVAATGLVLIVHALGVGFGVEFPWYAYAGCGILGVAIGDDAA